jgi:hypothetical protein
VVVVGEPEALALQAGAGLVAEFREAAVLVERPALLGRHPREEQVLVSDDVRRFNRRAQVAAQLRELHVRGRRVEPETLEGRLHLGGPVPEVARELDLPVPERRDLPERPLEVLLQLAAHGVELHADARQSSFVGGERERVPAEETQPGGGGPQAIHEEASVHRVCLQPAVGKMS